MRVAVFRAAGDGRRTAGKLAALGHAAMLAPVIEIVSTGVKVPADGDILVFTSAHAVEVLDREALPTRFRSMPCYCVGSRTAGAAQALGFSDVRSGDDNAAALAALIAKQIAPSRRIVLVAGRDRKPTVEETLRRSGFTLNVVEVYHARRVERWPPDVVETLRRSCDAALHYSRRSVDLAVEVAIESGLGSEMRRWRHYCLSDDVAAGLARHGLDDVVPAPHPDEQNLLALL
ncbi:uroporphyrinogen-III synthase [Lichenifustis flavocetrariae]|uniref:Uroporphyrinogen-III synthase n=1 Tax=Lichenifustis flavocetrariae TaxID=2949735 RepID=A0AA42CIZ9_9HYPH|nr:uroporphyrinogen-III synthase [Lichenifustis flavocetrariae]MCW6507426.1 uroporphyrinogen-III synthase [Lichenifustis flavocetrariae]